MVSKEQVKKEFDEFAKKVAKLQYLREELNALNVKGFETDFKLIKVKLKNVNAIPEIEREIEKLRENIKTKKDHHARESLKNAVSSKVEHDIIPKVNRVKREVSSKIAEDTQKLRRKINELENIIIKKKKVSAKRQLSKEEVKFVKDVPMLEKELGELKREFEKHTRSAKMKIDSGVGVLVDVKFDDFISQIKAELTERLKEKELTIDNQLKSDLEAREKLFAKKYQDLVSEFHERYRKQVDSELKNEVDKRFEDELNKKLAEERKKLVDALIKEDMQRLHAERTNMINMLHREYTEKENAEEKRLNEKLKKEEVKLRKRLSEERERLKQSIIAKKNELQGIEQKLREGDEKKMSQLDKEKNKLMVEIREREEKIRDKESLLKQKRQKCDFDFSRNVEKNDLEFARKVESMKRKMHDDFRNTVEKIKVESEQKVAAELKQKESQLRKHLESEYMEKAKEEVRKKEEALERKKEELEKHVFEQAKKILG